MLMQNGLSLSLELMEAVDTFIPIPPREVDKPFLMPVEDVFSITGRGTVATGRIERGVINSGEEVEIIGMQEKSLKSAVRVLKCSARSLIVEKLVIT